MFIDYANVFYLSERLHWHVEIKRLKQLLDSFDTIRKIAFYNGYLWNNLNSENLINEARKLKYEVHTKPVKVMWLSIDVSSIPNDSPAILNKFIDKSLIKNFSLEVISYLNDRLKELNDKGIKSIEHRKCNFDVEISRDMLLTLGNGEISNFVLWGGDSDFADPVNQITTNKKRVFIFSTARMVSVELSKTAAAIFDIQKIRNFICRNTEIQEDIKNRL